jgi:hypothetical protein
MFIVQARDMKSMRLHYYTGRAGSGWLSENRAEAFVYSGEGEANRKVAMFNRQYRDKVFMSAYANPDDAHAAGAARMSDDMCG